MATLEHEIVARFDTYEDYLDYKITQEHLYYLGSREVARQLFELGCVGGSEVIERRKFEQKKQDLAEQKAVRRSAQVPLTHVGLDLSFSPLMQKLGELEDEVRNGQKTVLIFIRGFNAGGQEVSAYIDWADRLRTEDWRAYFSGKKALSPKTTDMSYYNWKTRTVYRNESTSFQAKADSDTGIVISNTRDSKQFSVDPAHAADPGDNTVRIDIEDPAYEHIVLYVHSSRRKV